MSVRTAADRSVLRKREQERERKREREREGKKRNRVRSMAFFGCTVLSENAFPLIFSRLYILQQSADMSKIGVSISLFLCCFTFPGSSFILDFPHKMISYFTVLYQDWILSAWVNSSPER